MKNYYVLLLFTCFIGLAYQTNAQTPQNLYTVSPYTDSVWVVDTTTLTAQLPGTVLTSSSGTVTGCNGLAKEPCTGDMYIIYKVSGVTGRVLGILEPTTGVITEIGNTGDNFAGICFAGQGQLFGVTGDGATIPESLFSIDMTTAAVTLVTNYGAGSDGETIEFCDANGMIYHWSGRDTNPAMEKTDPATGTTTNITRTGYNYDEVFSAQYLGGDKFLLANLDMEFILVDTAGFATLLPTPTHSYYKGMAFEPGSFLNPLLMTQDTSIFCPGDSVTYYVNAGGFQYQWYQNGTAVAGGTSDTLVVNAPGPLYVEVIDGTCMFSSDTVTIQNYNLPNVAITPGDTAICAGETVLLTGSNGGQSQWYMNGSVIAGATANTYLVSQEGLYNMTKTNQNGCKDSAAVGTYITINTVPVVVLNPATDTVFCTNDSIQLTGSSGGSSQWYLNGVAIAGATSNTIWVSTPGYYNMVKTNTSGCADSSAVGVYVGEDPCGLGLSDLNEAIELKVFPSPVHSQLTVALKAQHAATMEMEIVDAAGKMHLRKATAIQEGSNDIQLEVASLSNGVYFLRIILDEGVYTTQFVKN